MKKLALWLKFSVFNFLIVAVFGVLMRWKIALPLPCLQQKNLQDAHSHFAFYGWVSSCIYLLVVRYLARAAPRASLGKYYTLVGINTLASYGMLAAFSYGGYFSVSIMFSAVALFASFVFFYFLLKDLKNIRDNAKIWLLAGFGFAVLSSLGVFTLAYISATKNASQTLYLAAQYFYLHFQYNGFFTFACIGLLLSAFNEINIPVAPRQNRNIFRLMLAGCILSYGLSVLWLNIPAWLYSAIVLGAIFQIFGLAGTFRFVAKNWPLVKKKWPPIQLAMLKFAALALALKTLLQLLSAVPSLSHFAFGFRTIVIAYLHLVLLMFIGTFLLSSIVGSGIFRLGRRLVFGLKLFMAGVFLNEAVLAASGLLSLNYVPFPYVNFLLLGISALIAVSLLLVFINLKKAAPRSGS